MKNNKNFSLGWYAFAAIGGLTSGLLFSKAQYHKGQADAYNKIANDLQELSDGIEQGLTKMDKKEEEA